MDDKKLMSEGLTIAPGVVETIISLAVSEVDGVAQIGVLSIGSSMRQAFSKKPTVPGVLILADDDGKISVEVHVLLYFGYRIQDVAANIRQTVFDVLVGQVGIEATAVDVYVDGVRFPS